MHEKQLIPRLIGRRFPKKGRIPMMKNRLARWLAVLLCLCLMPLPALAEGLDDTVEPTLSGGTPQRLFSTGYSTPRQPASSPMANSMFSQGA